MILDIGPRSIEHVCSVLARVKTLVWNGPFGAFELEPFDIGTIEVAEAAAELTAAGKIITVHLYLDRRRRLPRMAGGQAFAGSGSAQGQITVEVSATDLEGPHGRIRAVSET